MNEQFPLVSIIITTYNRIKLLPKAIESSQEQDYPNLEIVISDNCSSDGTEELVKKYLSDSRVRYFRNTENLGMLGNFRKATYEYSKGSFITYVNSDDYLTDKNYVSDAVKLYNSDNDICIVWARMGVKNSETGYFWMVPESPYFLKTLWDGKDVFLKSKETVLLSWGGCMMKREYMLHVRTFHAEFVSFDFESNYKTLMLGKAAFINRLCYIQLGHQDNAGFPVHAGKLIQNLQCYENVEAYAITHMPSRLEELAKWKDHFVYNLIVWAFYLLSERDMEQYKLFKEELKTQYPVYYLRFFKSTKYRRMQLVNIFKRILPKGVVHQLNIMRNQLKRKSN